MKIIVKATNFTLTPALREYIEIKIGSLEDMLQKLEAEGVIEARVEVAKTTKHHKKGDIFRAECNVRLPKKVLRAEHSDWNVRRSLDEIKKELQRQIKKYNEKARPQDTKGEKLLRKLRGK